MMQETQDQNSCILWQQERTRTDPPCPLVLCYDIWTEWRLPSHRQCKQEDSAPLECDHCLKHPETAQILVVCLLSRNRIFFLSDLEPLKKAVYSPNLCDLGKCTDDCTIVLP